MLVDNNRFIEFIEENFEIVEENTGVVHKSLVLECWKREKGKECNFDDIRAAIEKLARHDIRVSLFIDPDKEQIKASADVGAPVIELHTGRYADSEGAAQLHEFERIRQAVEIGVTHRLRVNAGHGLHYTNVQAIAEIPDISELNIGHAIVAHAVFAGWENAVREMKAIMIQSRLKARKT